MVKKQWQYNGCLPSARTLTQVEEFMTTAGADASDVQSALEGVQHMAWAGGGTLRRKNLVLLAFADVSACSRLLDRLQNHLIRLQFVQ